MSSIPVKVELTVDLNAYYPHLPVRLRNEINEAIVKLMSGGQARTVCKKPVKKKPTIGTFYSTALPPDTIFRVTGKRPMRSGTHTQKFLVMLKDTKELMKKELDAKCRDYLTKHGDNYNVDSRYSAMLSNMVRDGYLEIVG